MSDLIERLRCLDITMQFTGGQHPLITEAANRIEELEDDIAVAEENFKEQIKVHEKDRAEIEQLRAVYEAAKDAVEQNPPFVTLWLQDAVAAVEEANDE